MSHQAHSLLRGIHRMFAVMCLCLVASAFAADTARQNYDLPAGDAEKTLKLFTQQSGEQILYPPTKVSGVQTNAVKGELTPAEALNAMLNKTQLVAVRDQKTGAYTVQKAASTAEAEKNALSRRSNDPAATGEPRVVELPTFEVMGSKLLNMDIRRSVDDPQPYVVYNRETILQSGALDLGDFFKQRLTMNTVGQSSNQGSTGLRGQSMVNLRGLGYNQTLILIDGRRVAGAATQGLPFQPSVGSIPLAAIERVEILPTTSSGIYGGSATGGVVNIILRRDYTGAEIKLTYDNSFDTDSAIRRVDLGAGYALEGGKTNLMITASYMQANPLTQGDRDFYAGGVARVLANNPIFLLGASSPPIGATANIRSSNGTNLTLKNGTALNSPITFAPYGYGGGDGGAALVTNAGRYNFDLAPTTQNGGGRGWEILSGSEIASLGATIRRQFTPRINAYLDSAFSNARQLDHGSFAGTFSLPVAAPNNPFNQAVTVRVPVSGSDTLGGFFNQNWRVSGGVVAKLPADWMAAVDYTWNKTRLKSYSQNAFAVTASGAAAVASGTPDILRDPVLSPIDFESLLTTSQNLEPFDSYLNDVALRLSGPIWQSPAGPLTLSAAFEYRRDLFKEGTFLSSGTLSTYPERSQTNASGYLETYVPLVGEANRRFLVHDLGLQLAVRHDRYVVHATNILNANNPVANPVTNRNNSTNPTIAVKYTIIPSVSLRASYGTGFLPPSVNQLTPITQVFATNLGGIVDPRRGNTPPGGYTFVSSGNPTLTPEKSESWAAGLIGTPSQLPGLRLSLDYARIEKTNNIINLGLQQTVNNEALFPDRIGRAAPVLGDPYAVGLITRVDVSAINIARASLEAWDVSVDYDWKLAHGGKLSFFGAATYMPTYLTQIVTGELETDNIGKAGLANSVINPGIPLRWKGNAGITYVHAAWTLGWTTRYFHSYFAADPTVPTSANALRNQGNSGRIASQVYHDLFARYQFPPSAGANRWLAGTEFQVGVRNIFRRDPPYDASNTQSYYSYFGDPRGSSYYVSVKRIF